MNEFNSFAAKAVIDERLARAQGRAWTWARIEGRREGLIRRRTKRAHSA